MSRAYRPLLRHARERHLPSRAGLTRRDVLRWSLAGAAAAVAAPLVAGCRTAGRREDNDLAGLDARGSRTIIVGGGFAGLACAQTLADAGGDVVVLEAQPHPGGRVRTDRAFSPSGNIELGGEWIGTNHPTWIRYARRFDVELIEGPEYEGEEPVLLDGRRLDAEEVDAAFVEIDAALAALIEMARGVDPVRPYNATNAHQLDATSMADFIAARNMSEMAARLMTTIEEADNGVMASQMSLLGYLAVIAGGGFQDYYELSETHRTRDGNDRLTRGLAASLGERIICDAPVTAIAREATGVTVTTRDGRTFTGDAVVLAAPPTVWGEMQVTPALDAELAPQMGRNTKLLLNLRRPVWNEANVTPEMLADGPVQLSWESSKISRGAGPTTMTLFSGAGGVDQMHALDAGQRAAEAISSIIAAYPGLADAVEADRFIDWPATPTARGSYSFAAPGQVTRQGPTLVDGLRDDLAPMMFAGEHTSYGFAGYMEGALSSGVRAARALAASRQGSTA